MDEEHIKTIERAKTFVITYREEFCTEVLAKNKEEALKKVNDEKTTWELIGEPHTDFLVVEEEEVDFDIVEGTHTNHR